MKLKCTAFTIMLAVCAFYVHGHEHPSLAITKKGVAEIRMNLGRVPMLDHAVEMAIQAVDAEIKKGISVPLPKDLAGGFSHEQHKRNFFTLQKSGLLYQITGKEKYAIYIRDVLFEYARLFPTIDRHPATRSYAPGKFFWQCLNDANWLVYVSQAYDCIYDWLDKKDRQKLNSELFRPYADFLSVETPQFFNRIHNHSTWGNAAVGMIGLVMEDDELVERALYGINAKVPSDLVRDNDGGLIALPGQSDAGFIAQIDHSFSPDGYYTEGPYYQRYAMYPFLIFAQALQQTRPALKIFEYRNGVLIKAVHTLLNLTDADGEFFPVNDAQKGMSYFSRELVLATNVGYYFGDQDAALLDIIGQQGIVTLNDAGLSSALALSQGLENNFVKKSMLVRDGADGDEGAIGILRSRSTTDTFSMVMKYAKHGMGHGHFDQLSISYYHNGNEVYQDYGAARWVNVEQKDGGGYLKENTTWAKQTIAHNTVTVNETSQFNANVEKADQHHATPYLFDTARHGIQVVSARETNAYEGVDLHRTAALIENDIFPNPVLLDIFRISSDVENQYDLPYYFQGEVMQTNFSLKQPEVLIPLGKNNGYQHLYLEAEANPGNGNAVMNWFYKTQFYTLTAVTNTDDRLIFGRIGASDPNFNLRRDPAFIIRKSGSNILFASLTEIHGSYSPVTEIASDAYGRVKAIKILKNNESYAVIRIETKAGRQFIFALCNHDNSKDARHKLTVDNRIIEWQGTYTWIENKTE